MLPVHEALKEVVLSLCESGFRISTINKKEFRALVEHQDRRFVEQKTCNPDFIIIWGQNELFIQIDKAEQILKLKDYIYQCPLPLSFMLIGVRGRLYVDRWYRWRLVALNIHHESGYRNSDLIIKIIQDWINRAGLLYNSIMITTETPNSDYVSIDWYYPFYVDLAPLRIAEPLSDS